MGEQMLLIFGVFLFLMVVIGLYMTIKEFNEMEDAPEQYSPNLENENVQVRD
jgi:hypothetical protein